ncbi:MAG: calcium/sodium antiporter [Clostridia bacterium]|nr:calcium/sodium antiporter [Clostridia bacterium]
MFLENIPYQYYLLAFGVILLIKGGDWFVDAATGIARRFKLPELLIGATVVSIGTTLPEVLTSAMAAASNNAATAYGNAIGSIICNTSLIAAITIAIKPAKADKKTLIFPVCFFFGAAAFYSFCAYYFNSFPRWTGIVLLVGFVAYMIINVVNMKKNPVEQELPEIEEQGEESEEKSSSLGFIKDIGMLVVSAAIIAVGAHLLGDNAQWLAEVQLGIPGEIVSLTIVALATSLPELVTAITALAKGHGALSLGNIIGANIFNLVLVSGAAITIAPFDIPSGTQLLGQSASLLIDVPLVFLVMGIMTIPTILKGKLQRWQGISLLAIYVSYVVFQVVMALAFAG